MVVIDMLRHAVFTVNVAGALAFVIWRGALHAARGGARAQRAFIGLSLSILVFTTLYVLLMTVLVPDKFLEGDGSRYFYEIGEIARAPWRWNPILGTGPGYNESAKMGMSYLYGIVGFAHRIASPCLVLTLNIACGFLTCFAVYLLTCRLTASVTPALVAMGLAAVYPEILYWHAKCIRENLALLLVPAFVYAAMQAHDTLRPRYFVYAAALVGLLTLVRAQLALFLLLAGLYYGAAALSHRAKARTVLFMALVGAALWIGGAAALRQVERAAGSTLSRYLTTQTGFWSARVRTAVACLPYLMSAFGRQSHGLMGIALAPFFIGLLALLALMAARFRRIFGDRRQAAGLLAFCSAAFILALAANISVNIRYRSTVAPLVICLAAVTAHHYWRALGLPAVVLARRARPPVGAAGAPAAGEGA